MSLQERLGGQLLEGHAEVVAIGARDMADVAGAHGQRRGPPAPPGEDRAAIGAAACRSPAGWPARSSRPPSPPLPCASRSCRSGARSAGPEALGGIEVEREVAGLQRLDLLDIDADRALGRDGGGDPAVAVGQAERQRQVEGRARSLRIAQRGERASRMAEPAQLLEQEAARQQRTMPVATQRPAGDPGPPRRRQVAQPLGFLPRESSDSEVTRTETDITGAANAHETM